MWLSPSGCFSSPRGQVSGAPYHGAPTLKGLCHRPWGLLTPGQSRYELFGTTHTCPFPTPVSPRYDISIALFLSRFYLFGNGLPGSFPEQPHSQRKRYKMRQETIPHPKTSRPVSLPSRGDKTGQNQDISRIKADSSRTFPDKIPPTPRSNVRKCPLFLRSADISLQRSNPAGAFFRGFIIVARTQIRAISLPSSRGFCKTSWLTCPVWTGQDALDSKDFATVLVPATGRLQSLFQ